LFCQVTIIAILEIFKHTEERFLIELSGVTEIPERREYRGIAIVGGVLADILPGYLILSPSVIYAVVST
jgi:hypothetical protein